MTSPARSVVERQASAGTGLADRLYRHLPAPRALAVPSGRPVRILALTKGDNPSFSYYLESRLQAPDAPPFDVRCIDRDNLDDIEPDGLFVVICRYIRPAQLGWLERHRARLAGVALFVDDDMAALLTGRDGSLFYRAYVGYFGCLPLRRLNPLLTDVWASTPHLQRLLAEGGHRVGLLPPRPVLADNLPADRRARSKALRVAFHATDIHGSEHRFLVPIIERAMQDHPDVTFEVLARGANRRLWRQAAIDPARMTILPLMPWPAYRRHTRDDGADILLVPLLEGRANAARADTKRIEACRMGAAAVFSAGTIYSQHRRPGEHHVENRPESWLAALNELLHSPEARQRLAATTRASVVEMAEAGPAAFPFADPKEHKAS